MNAAHRETILYLAGLLIRFAFEHDLIPPWYTEAEALRAIADILERG